MNEREVIYMIQAELAQSLNVSRAKVNDLSKMHRLQGVKSGKVVKYPASEIRRLFKELGIDIPKLVIAINNIKGGVGKTLLVRELAYMLAQHGARVLMIDLDLQGTLSEICGVYNDELPTWKNVIKGEIKPKELAIPLRENLSIIPCNIGMGGIEREIGQKNKALLVKQHLKELQEEFDIILLDTRPEISDINLSAIISSDVVIVPAKADAGSHKGIKDTFREIEFAQKEYGEYTAEKGIDKIILINLFKSSRNTELLKFSEITAEFSEDLFEGVLSDHNDMAKAYNEKEFLYELKRNSPVNKFLRKLASQVLNINKPKIEVPIVEVAQPLEVNDVQQH